MKIITREGNLDLCLQLTPSRDAASALIAYIDKIMQIGSEEDNPLKSLPTSFASLIKLSQGNGLRILELGSGCGVVGIWMASSFPRTEVIMTDLPEAMSILEMNMVHTRLANGSKLARAELDWHKAVPKGIAERSFDLIIVSDCTYNCDSVPALIKTIAVLLRQCPEALVVIAMKIRHESELAFFDLMTEGGLAKVEKAVIGLSHIQDGSAVGPPRDAVEVHVYRVQDAHDHCIA